MKTMNRLFAKRTLSRVLRGAALLAVAGFSLRPPAALAQGALTPPGAPAPTMKTLSQVEPRTAISSAPFTISASGSYYLTANLSGSVTIATNDVSLDLMGFSVTVPSGAAIKLSGSRQNVRVHNGVVSASGGYGFDFSASDALANGRIEGIRVRNCGSYGIVVGSGFEVRDCVVTGATSAGIRVHGNSIIRNNRVTGCGRGLSFTGSGALADGNLVFDNTDNYDFSVGHQLNLLLSQIPESLDWPCSVKLAGSLTTAQTGVNGIMVNANDVFIDLAGHTLSGPGATSKSGIYQSDAWSNLTVKNGQVVNWSGTEHGGIYGRGNNVHVQNVQAKTNYYGISLLGGGSAISGCEASKNTSHGINGNTVRVFDCTAYDNAGNGLNIFEGSTISHCVAYANAGDGIFGFDTVVISACTARSNAGGGISVGYGCTVYGCTSKENAGEGIAAASRNTLENCTVTLNKGHGVVVYADNVVRGCGLSFNGCNSVSDRAGLYVLGPDNRIDGNNATNNDRGIEVVSGGNFITRNTASGNTTNWKLISGNVCLVVQAATSGAINGNSGGTAPGSTDPNANFTF